jgi:membrane protein implicated in regulation of membrane protease activity
MPVLMLVTIGWLYVVLLMALAERSLVAGMATFVLYGLLPLSVVLYLLATPVRRRARRRAAEAQREAALSPATTPPPPSGP